MADDRIEVGPPGDTPIEVGGGRLTRLRLRRPTAAEEVTAPAGPRLVHVLELQSVSFHTDSAVLLPEGVDESNASSEQATDEEPVTGLLAVRTALKFAGQYPAKRLLIAGHTDTTGGDAHNLELSRRRAENVQAYLRGDRDAWAASCAARHRVADWQQLLVWVARTRSWDCDAGTVDDKSGPASQGALRRFREAYAAEKGPLPGKGTSPTLEDWKAFYDLYDDDLARRLECAVADLPARREVVKPLDPAAVGCGEAWPIEKVGVDGHPSTANRRVELLFFDETEAPSLACHAGATCTPAACPLYAPGGGYRAERIPVEVDDYVPVDGAALEVGFPDDLGARLPEGLVLRLLAGERPPVEVPWPEGKLAGAERRFAFEGLPAGVPFDLIAVAGGDELALWEQQVVDGRTPVTWSHVLDELARAEAPPDEAVTNAGPFPEDDGLGREPPVEGQVTV